MKDPIKQRIQLLVPNIMEIGFGCYVSRRVNGAIYQVIKKAARDNRYVCIRYDDSQLYYLARNEFDILGRAVTLVDVLIAAPRMKIARWNFSDDYDGQSGETKRFIGELLGIEKNHASKNLHARNGNIRSGINDIKRHGGSNKACRSAH